VPVDDGIAPHDGVSNVPVRLAPLASVIAKLPATWPDRTSPTLRCSPRPA